MTDTIRDAAPCQELRDAWASYHAGSLDEPDMQRLEDHAASCSACATWLERHTRLEPALLQVVPSDAVRARILREVSTPVPFAPRRRPWMVTVGAAAVLMVALSLPWREGFRTGGGVGVTPAVTGELPPPTADAVQPSSPVAMLTTAEAMAAAQAADEFRALDEAARELEAALATTPSDQAARDGLAAVRARRAELQSRVREAAL